MVRLSIVTAMAFTLIFIMGFVPSASAQIPLQTASAQAITPFAYYGDASQYYFPSFTTEKCESGQDFYLEIPPLGCTPQIVRSDLLEEQDVPVFCRLIGTKLNPVIEVPHIKSITLAPGQQLNKTDIRRVLFHPARAGLTTPFAGLVGSPQLNELGYLVVVLKRKATEKEMPDIVTADLVTKITYSFEKSFGVSDNELLIPEMTAEEWKSSYKKYGFWKGKGYIRAESITEGKAKIKMYRDADSVFDSFSLKPKEETGPKYMPGFYCSAGYELTLKGIEYPQLRADISVDGNSFVATKGMEVGSTDCKVKKIIASDYGLGGEVILSCPDGTHTLIRGIMGEIKLTIKMGSQEKTSSYKIGDEIKLSEVGGVNPPMYFAYSIKIPDKENKEVRDVVVLVEIEGGKKVESTIKKIRREMKKYLDENAGKLSNKKSEELKKEIEWELEDNIAKIIVSSVKVNVEPHVIIDETEITTTEGKNQKVTIKADIEGLENKIYDSIIEDYYDDAEDAYKKVVEDYGELKDVNGVPYGAKALSELAKKADTDKLGKEKDRAKFLKEIITNYPGSGLADEAGEQLSDIYSSFDAGKATKYIKSGGRAYSITLNDIISPTSGEMSIDISVDEAPSENKMLFDEVSDENDWLITKIEENKVTFESANESKTVTVSEGEEKTFGRIKTKVIRINLKKLARVSIEPWSNKGITYANFTFNIGVEKRAIKLNPEQTSQMITDIDKQIEEWQKVYDRLGKLVKQWKNACLVGAGTLWLMNALENIGTARTMARNRVMRGFGEYGGMIEECNELVAANPNEYPSQTRCLLKMEPKIKEQTQMMENAINNFNSKLEKIKKSSDVWITADKAGLWSSKRTLDGNAVSEELQKIINNYGIELETAQMRKEGYMYSSDEKELITYLHLKDKCADKDDAFCKGVENTLGRKLKRLSDSKTQYDIDKALQEQLSRGLGIDVPKLPPAINLDKKTITPEVAIKSYSDIALIKVGISTDKVAEEIAFIPTTTATYVAIISTAERNKITKLFEAKIEANKWTSSKEISKEAWPANLADYVKGASLDSCITASPIKNPEIRFWESGANKGLPAYIPLNNIKRGWYFLTSSSYGFGLQSYQESGKIENFWLCGVGGNGKPDFDFSTGPRGDDAKSCCTHISNTASTQTILNQVKIYGFTKNDIDKLRSCIGEASKLYRSGVKDRGISCCTNCKVGKPAVASPATTCYDFMDPSECNLMFNLCDPVICPSSRCDLGGRYPVDDVIQTGIIGGLTLCLPNAVTENIIMPVCLTGVHAGLDNVLNIMKASKACLNESLRTGRQIGICDQLTSVYWCELLWREMTPMLKTGIPNLIERGFIGGLFGTRKTGGEYYTFTDSWNAAGESFKFITNYYGEEVFRAFQIRSIAEAGSMICKQFISVPYPDQVDFIDELTEPESPYQATAFFYETPMTSATVPAMSHYKVYYNIYAGRDSGHYYSIYLRQAPSPGYYETPELYPVPEATGYLTQGQYIDISKDFTAPAGYNEICVRIDNKDECGFGKSSTNFALSYITDSYTSEQAAEEVSTVEECVSGTPGMIAPNLNPQQIVEETLQPTLYKRGITRICSSKDPGLGTEPGRWSRVGFCDPERNIGCWLDGNSIEGAIKDLGIQDKTLEEAEDIANRLFDEAGFISSEEAEKIFKDVEDMKVEIKRKLIDLKLKEQIGKTDNTELKNQINNVISKAIDKLNYIIEKASLESEDTKAEAQTQIGLILNFVVDSLVEKAGPVGPPRELFRVYFDYNRYEEEYMDKTEDEIEEIMLRWLGKLGKGNLYVSGWASEEGTEQHNLDLSDNRSKAVYDIIYSFSSTLKEKEISLMYFGGGETDEHSTKESGTEKVNEMLQKIKDATPEEKAKVASTNPVNEILSEDRVVIISFESTAGAKTAKVTTEKPDITIGPGITEEAEKPTAGAKNCILTTADWATVSGIFNVVVGDDVELHVQGNSVCAGKEVEFTIKEEDRGILYTGSDAAELKAFAKGKSTYQQPKNAVFDSHGRAVTTWMAEWVADGLVGNPEYRFMAKLYDAPSNYAFSNNQLKVSKGKKEEELTGTIEIIGDETVLTGCNLNVYWEPRSSEKVQVVKGKEVDLVIEGENCDKENIAIKFFKAKISLLKDEQLPELHELSDEGLEILRSGEKFIFPFPTTNRDGGEYYSKVYAFKGEFLSATVSTSETETENRLVVID